MPTADVVQSDVIRASGVAARARLPQRSVATLIISVLLGAALLAGGAKALPTLHTILDTSMCLLSGILALLFWDMGVRLDLVLKKYLAFSFAATCALEFVHVFVSLDWPTISPLARTSADLAPLTWPPSALILPIGIGGALWLSDRRRGVLWFPVVIVFASIALCVVYAHVRPYAPTVLGISRPSLVVVPIVWLVVILKCWDTRNADPIAPALGLMSWAVMLASIAMLYSQGPDDSWAMVAHLGRITGYLALLLVLMELASHHMAERLRTQERLIQTTKELADSGRMASLGALVAGIAHDLNTPIGNALMVSSSFRESIALFGQELTGGSLRRSSIDQHLKTAEEAAQLLESNLNRASAQIVAFKQIAADQTSNLRRSFNLNRCVEDSVRSCTPMLRAAHVTTQIEIDPKIDMDSYPGALSQIVINLVENAIRHGLAMQPEGNIRIFSTQADAASVRLTLSDDGVGIPDQLAPNVFAAFFTTRGGNGGTGLGLHISKSLARGQLGGDLALDACQEGGARFALDLPLQAPAEALATAESHQRAKEWV